jgi:hypothetical protein
MIDLRIFSSPLSLILTFNRILNYKIKGIVFSKRLNGPLFLFP